MDKQFEHILNNLEGITPDAALHPRIMARINTGMRRRVRMQLFTSGVFSLISLVAIIYTGDYIIGQLSVANAYFSLLFTDGATIFSYWREFALALAESMPLTGIAIILGGVLAFLLSLRWSVKSMHRMSAWRITTA
jgi:hypothetical protein